ncbi:MAG: hypothetical protein WCP39_06460, partial [Chlamydiota bacterium]
YRHLYCNFELSEDEGYAKYLLEKFDLLDASWLSMCVEEARVKREQNITNIEDRKKEIGECEKELQKSNLTKREKYKLTSKITRNKKSIERAEGITFGGRDAIQKITHLSNQINGLSGTVGKETKKQEREREENLEKKTNSLNETKKEYRQQRLCQVYFVGRACEGGNRKMDFFFDEGKVVLKINRDTHMEFILTFKKREKKYLPKLQEMLNNGEMPVSFRTDGETLNITFDDKLLHGYAFNKKAYLQELKALPKENKEERKEVGVKWAKELTNRMLIGKIADRTACIDLNPENIGAAVLQKTEDKDKPKVLFAQNYDLTKYEKAFDKLRKQKKTDEITEEEYSEEKKHLNDKLKTELGNIYKEIFAIATHYRCAMFAMEDLNFKFKVVSEESRAFNRKVKNIWHRLLQEQLIEKHCSECGIRLEKVSPLYSSFIGNIKNKYYDPVNAAIEIGRRGLYKYEKGSFYPSISRSDIDTMCHAFGLDVRYKTIILEDLSWKQLYNEFSKSELRYRHGLDFVTHEDKNLQSHKSKIKVQSFV